MSKRSILRLIGAVQLAGGADCIGLPLFSYAGTNHNYVATCGNDLRIAGFALFDEFDDYGIDSNLPPIDHSKEYEIGDPMPIPVWVDGQLNVVLGSSPPSVVDEEPLNRGSRPTVSEVLNSLQAILYDAHSGKYENRRAQWQSEGLRAAFGDVFYEPPVHSRYWISRFILAASTASRNDTGQIEIEEELREVAHGWLSHFLTKTDFNRLTTIVGLKGKSVFSDEEARGILFIFLASKIEGRSHREVERLYKEPLVQTSFPNGIYGYYVDCGWPDVGFEAFDSGERLLPNFKSVVYGANRSGLWAAAERMSCILFGQENAPREIQTMIDPLVSKKVRELQRIVENSAVLLHSLYVQPEDKATIVYALELYQTIQQMDGIIYGSDRMSRNVVDGRYGVSASLIENLKLKVSK